jgi:hypothetical protein
MVMKQTRLVLLLLLHGSPATAGPTVQPPPPSWKQWDCYMQGAIFNEQCRLYGPEAQRVLKEEIARYRSLAEKERPDLVNQGYFNRFDPAKKTRALVCDGFIPNYAAFDFVRTRRRMSGILPAAEIRSMSLTMPSAIGGAALVSKRNGRLSVCGSERRIAIL